MSGTALVYREEPLGVYLDDAASGKPAPGGGSVSACVGALGAALVVMVCNLTIGREAFADAEPEIKRVAVQCEEIRAELECLLQEDTVAYNGVIAAYKMAKRTEAEKAARAEAVQIGLVHAANVPLDICRASLRASRLAKVAAELGNPAAVTDAGIGALLGEAAVVGAALNVKINLGSIKDRSYVERVAAELEELQAEATALRAEVLATTLSKL